MAYDLDGTDDRIDFAETTNLTASPVSHACWMVLDVAPVTGGYIIQKESNDVSVFAGLLLWIDSSRRLVGFVSFDGGQNCTRRHSSASMATATLTHVGMSYDGTGNATGIKLYVNGSEVGGYTSATDGTGSRRNHDADIAIGGRQEDDTRNVNAKLSEFGVWTRVLAATEFATLAAGYSPRFLQNGLLWAPPLVRGLGDPISGVVGTLNSVPVVYPHPPIIYPSRPQVFTGAAAAAGNNLAWKLAGRRPALAGRGGLAG